VTRFSISVPDLAARLAGLSSSVAFSPDGQEIVYVVAGANPGLERRRLNEMTAERIRGAEGGTRPFFSPDGKWIGFVVGTKLRKVAVAGGSPVTICDVEVNARASWGDDNTIVVARPGLWKVSAAGGKLEPLFEASDRVGQFVDPYVLPGSRAVLVQNRRPPNQGFIEAIDLQTRSRHRLVEGTSGRLTATGDLLFTRQGQLSAIKFDPTRLAVIGSAVPVLEAPGFAAKVDFTEGAYAISSNGSLAYVAGSATASLIWLDPKGTSSVLAGVNEVRYPRLSPDGTRIAITGGNPANIYVLEIGRPGSRLPLTTSNHNRGGTWSPDSQQIAFFSAPRTPEGSLGDQDLFVMPAAGGTPRRVLERRGGQWADSWAPDGRSLIFDDGPGYSRDLWVLLIGGEARPLVADPRFNERGGAFSPDGKSFAFVSNVSGRDEVYVEPFPGPGQRVPISSDGGLQPVWSRDGRELFYRQGDALMAVPVQLDPFRAGAPQKRLDMPRALYGLDPYLPEYDVAADGRVLTVRRDGISEIHVVLNWAEELRRALGR
jgi:eukaryotic-like serine/threonine-protein kinase